MFESIFIPFESIFQWNSFPHIFESTQVYHPGGARRLCSRQADGLAEHVLPRATLSTCQQLRAHGAALHGAALNELRDHGENQRSSGAPRGHPGVG